MWPTGHRPTERIHNDMYVYDLYDTFLYLNRCLLLEETLKKKGIDVEVTGFDCFDRANIFLGDELLGS